MAGRPLGVHPLLLYQEGVKVKADVVGETFNLIFFIYVQPDEWECSIQREVCSGVQHHTQSGTLEFPLSVLIVFIITSPLWLYNLH